MTALHLLWSAFVWLPAWARVVLAALVWWGFAELIGLFCSVGTRLDRQIDRPIEARRAAMARPLPQARPFRPGTAR